MGVREERGERKPLLGRGEMEAGGGMREVHCRSCGMARMGGGGGLGIVGWG